MSNYVATIPLPPVDLLTLVNKEDLLGHKWKKKMCAHSLLGQAYHLPILRLLRINNIKVNIQYS